MMRQNFASGGFASASAYEQLTYELDDAGISGGAIYDALVAVAAREVGRPLLSSDRRAATTYARLAYRWSSSRRDLPQREQPS